MQGKRCPANGAPRIGERYQRGVKNKDITIRSKGLCNLLIVLLTLSKRTFSRDKNLPSLSALHSLSRAFRHSVSTKLNLTAKKPASFSAAGRRESSGWKPWCHLFDGHGSSDDLYCGREEVLDGWKCKAPNAGVVSNNVPSLARSQRA